MRHDPQRTAAAYLGGQLPRRHRDRFEAHLLACEDCWGEVQASRRGRALAETAREGMVVALGLPLFKIIELVK